MNIHTTSVPEHFRDLLELQPPKISKERHAHRIVFKPLANKPGLIAKVQVPNEGHIKSLALKLDGANASGELYLSVADPTFDYDSFFLYTVLDNVPITTTGPKMWRKTGIHGVSYSSNQGTQGYLFLLILNGPDAELRADIALTVQTD